MEHEKEKSNLRFYKNSESAVFRKTTEKWGGLSNMAAGYPLVVNGIFIRSSEALYQACRYPNLPEVQEKIISQTSPMTAKMVGKPYRDETRKDWNSSRIVIMKWCLRVKLVQNYEKFSTLVTETKNLSIVESSNKDAFWGARPVGGEMFEGVNALGRLLMELRDLIHKFKDRPLEVVLPPSIDNFLLFGEQVREVRKLDSKKYKDSQSSLFDV
jgi:ribA/ribD-fused uncharacterized protein